MGKKELIYDLLRENDLTTAEISEKSGLDENQCRTYVNRLKKSNLVNMVGKKDKGYKIYRAINGYKSNMNNRFVQDKIDKMQKQLNALREMFETGVLKVYGDKLTPEYQSILEEL